jgi:hypothetical protein
MYIDGSYYGAEVENRQTFQAQREGGGGAGYLGIKYTHANILKGQSMKNDSNC